LIYLSGAVALS